MLSKMIVQLLSFALVVSVIMGEQYTFDFTKRDAMKSPSLARKGVDASLSARMLQSGSSSDSCYLSNNKIVCVYSFVAGSIGNETTIEFMAECDNNPQYGFDFRRASNCACVANVIPAHGATKQCPCTVCAVDLGETPVSVDCSVHEQPATIATTSRAENITDDVTGSVSIDDSVSIPADNVTIISNNTGGEVNITVVDANTTEVSVDPFIFATCSSIDCFGACNGTCSFNCNDPSGNVCSFCETYTGSGAITSAPTGSGNNQIGDLGAPPQSAPSSALSQGVTTGLLVITVAVVRGFLI
jgi:hypothetical protein